MVQTKAKRGLMMGRFQPPHMGHMDMIKQVLDECQEVIIAVTSSQFNYLKKDPFTAGERVEMIHNSLLEARHLDSNRCMIIPIQNQFNIATWFAYLRSILPSFDRVYSGNQYVEMLLADSGVQVVRPALLDRDMYNATRIRNMIVSGDNEGWRKIVPEAVGVILDRINARDRLVAIAESDTNPTEH